MAAATAKKEGDNFYVRRDFQDAVASYTRALEADPKNYIIYSNRSAAYLAMGDARNALQDAEEAIKLNPSKIASWMTYYLFHDY